MMIIIITCILYSDIALGIYIIIQDCHCINWLNYSRTLHFYFFTINLFAFHSGHLIMKLSSIMVI